MPLRPSPPQAQQRAGNDTDFPIAVAADTAAAVVALLTNDTVDARGVLAEVLERRTLAPGRYVMVAGGPMGASLDEPDVAALVVVTGTDAPSSAARQGQVSGRAHIAPMTTARRPAMTKTTSTTAIPWNPTATELESILASMRPIIDRFVDHDRRHGRADGGVVRCRTRRSC